MSMAGHQAARWSWRQAAALVAAVEAIAVAVWLIPASVVIVNWSAAGPQRVALFAPRATLVWLVAVGLLGALALAAWSRRTGRMTSVAGAATPFCLLWTWAVPYLPWLPDRVPLLLVLAGPIRWVVGGIALAAAVQVDRRLRRWVEDVQRLPGRRAIFLASFAVYLVFGLYGSRAVGPGGDEPHYLIIAQSLLADGDVQIENNHRAAEYRRFFNGELRPDYLRRGVNGQIYSIHAPGLAFLMLPAYAVAGYSGAVVFLCLLAALAARAVFDLAESLAGRGPALVAWLGVCLTIPFVPYSWLVFPEIAGALAVAWAALWLWQPAEQRPSIWIWRGMVLGYLPWLHTKFLVFLAAFAAGLLLRLWKRPRVALAFGAPVAASLVVWLLFFYSIYGEFNPGAPYGNYANQHIMISNIPRGVLGLMVDQKFGLLFYSPIYLFAVAGCWIMLRRPDYRYLGAVCLLAVAVFVGGATELYMWWGGNSAPARYLVPLLPCLAPMIAVAVGAARTVWVRALLGVWLSISLGLALVGAAWPSRFLIFSEPHGRARLLETIQAGAPLALSIPTFTTFDWQQSLVALVPWLAAAAFGLLTMIALSRWRTTALWLGTAGAGVSLLSAGVLTGRATAEVREDAAARGALAVMWRYDPHALRAFDYTRLRRMDAVDLLRVSTLAVRQAGSGADNRPRGVAGPFALPPGSYQARVWFSSTRPQEGEILVSSSRRAVFGRSTGVFQNPAVVPFELPVGARRVSVAVGDATVAVGVNLIEVKPADIVPVAEREDLPVRAIESIAGRPDAHVVYLDDHAYPEGGVFWTRSTERATVLITPAGASRIVLTLHLGPKSGEVVVDIAGKETRVHVNANDTAVLDVEAPPDVRLVPISIQSPGSFRPAEVDPASTDTRLLGCQVRVDIR
jgi:hypothetical protein